MIDDILWHSLKLQSIELDLWRYSPHIIKNLFKFSELYRITFNWTDSYFIYFCIIGCKANKNVLEIGDSKLN